MLSFFPRDALDKILNLIESVSDGFLPTHELEISKKYKLVTSQNRFRDINESNL